MYAIADQLDNVIQRRYNKWKSSNMPPYLKKELNDLKSGEITDRFYKHLDFGSEGMRGKVGVGTNRMNMYSVRRISQGLATEIKSRGFAAQQRGVIIAYDSRLHSRSFAEQAALVLACNEIKVYLFEQPGPTPLLAFAVRWLHTAAGIVISGGNYSSEFNGFNIYGENGAPIQTEMKAKLTLLQEDLEDGLQIGIIDPQEAIRKGILVGVGKEIDEAYFQYLQQIPLSKEPIQLLGSALRMVYTPLQGTGGIIVKNALEQAGFTEVYTVAEHHHPDMSFSVVKDPDPYDPIALAATVRLAAESNADFIIASNPETTELSLSVKNGKGDYLLLNGNQTAALLLNYICMQKKKSHMLPSNGIVFKTVLTSEMATAIAAHYGLQLKETMYGFSHIAEKMADYQKNGEKTFIFGFEEKGGFAVNGFVRDKDGIQASLLIAEMAAYGKSVGSTLYGQLMKLYQTYGWFAEDYITLSFSGLEGWQQIRNVMERLRSEAPMVIEDLKVTRMYDYRKGKFKDLIKNRMHISDLPPADVLKYVLEDGSWYAIRPAETEPALNFYFGSTDNNEFVCKQKLTAIRSAVLYKVESII
jgi:phosphoglucomutase